MNLRIQTCYWGGEPIRVINGEEGFNRDDVRTLKRWGDFLSDPAKGEQPWIDGLSQGQTWLDLPSADGRRRLLLRVFRRDQQGSRPLWFFSAFSFDIALAEPASWAAAIRRLLVKTEKEISEANGCIELDVIALSSRSVAASPLGTVFRGSYGSALDRYCEALAGYQWDEIGGLFSASHPPSSHPDFTTLLISDDFCYQGIRVIEKAAPATPEPTPQTRIQKTDGSSKIAWTQQVLARFKMPIFLAAIFFSFGFFLKASQFQSTLNSLEGENQVLRAQIRTLIFEKQKLERDNQSLKRPSDSPTTKGRQPVSPADRPNQIRNP